jgi:hypothetical protein
MNIRRFAPTLLSLVLVTISATLAFADGAKPVQLSLFNPIQLFPEKTSISGVRLSLIYGCNDNVQGVDWGLVNHVRGDGFSWQSGGVGIVEKNFTGFQNNVVNLVQGEFTGLQYGAFNQVDKGNGCMVGLVNVSKSMHGVQVGLLNMTETMHGLQIGVGNIIQKGGMPFLPIVNWSK